MRPVPQSDGHDRLWLIDELVPSFATGLDDGVIIFEDAVGEPILAQVLPDILDRVQLGGIVTLIEGGRNGLQQCPFRLPRSRNPTH